MGAWLVLAVMVLTWAAFLPNQGARFVLILLGSGLLLSFWAALRWPDKL